MSKRRIAAPGRAARPLIVLAGGLGVAALAGCGGSGTATVTVVRTVTRAVTTTAPAPGPAACAGDALAGAFAVVQGSAGAGQVSYRLRLTNDSGSACFLSGLPELTLLDAQGAELPTHVTAAQPGQATAVRVELAPGEAAVAEARFSPDVPGPNEGQPGQCEPTAATARLAAPGGGTVGVPVEPPTPVCSHGSLRFSVYTAA